MWVWAQNGGLWFLHGGEGRGLSHIEGKDTCNVGREMKARGLQSM